jgi:hypothetical protein
VLSCRLNCVPIPSPTALIERGCSICPCMAVGNLAHEAVVASGVKLKKWPKWVDAVGGGPFAFGLFFALLMWEELWDLPQDGALSAWLLLLITSGAVFNSVQYENRMWCRHLCPIGAMRRTFGTVSMTEVRSFEANCQGCTEPQCVNGISAALDPSDKFALKGCTMELKNNQMNALFCPTLKSRFEQRISAEKLSHFQCSSHSPSFHSIPAPSSSAIWGTAPCA